MYVIVQHQLTDPPAAFSRGERLKRGDGAPEGVRVLQFYPSQEGAAVTCLWEAGSVGEVQTFVDDTLGDSSINVCYAVDPGTAFADLPAGLPQRRAAVIA
ncbi:MAG: hypothetical protein H0W14_09950 [Actinobacteria bacterium]|nr:hypothetical protein [Actinomycetota bacterium]